MSGAGWDETIELGRDYGESEGTHLSKCVSTDLLQMTAGYNVGPQHIGLWISQAKLKIKSQISKYTVRAHTVMAKTPHLRL